LTTGVALALLSSLVALGLASVFTTPIAALVRGARRVSEGELDVKVDVAPQDEFRELGEAFNDMVQSLRASREALNHQVRENERLLVSLLPASAAAQMRDGVPEAPRSFSDVTVAFASLGGFDELSPRLGEDESMSLLSDIVAAFDEAAEQHGVEKVRTIGSSYLAASGLSVDRPDHTARMVDFAKEIVRIVKRFNTERQASLSIEIGINTGPVVGGLVGRRKFIYDLWGDTVKLAKNIEADGKTSILVTKAVYERVRDLVVFEPARKTELRGVGTIDLYQVAEEAV
jgi:class 3 adenylate cyclase